jgi:hypothetical protein
LISRAKMDGSAWAGYSAAFLFLGGMAAVAFLLY